MQMACMAVLVSPAADSVKVSTSSPSTTHYLPAEQEFTGERAATSRGDPGIVSFMQWPKPKIHFQHNAPLKLGHMAAPNKVSKAEPAHMEVEEAFTYPKVPEQLTVNSSVGQELGFQTRGFPGKRKVWIRAFPRSASSTLLSMVTVTNGSRKVFELFEPCHTGDVLDAELEARGCAALLLQLFNCNFTGIKRLYGWGVFGTGHTDHNGAKRSFSPENAAAACANADILAIKTIDFADYLESEAFPILDADPALRMIDVVRDPRSILASTRTTPGDFHVRLLDMCDAFYANMNVSHQRMHRVVYERLVTYPNIISAGVYHFIDIPFGETERQWVVDHFNAPCSSYSAFSDCRRNSSEHIERYRGELTNDQFAAFMGTETCRNMSFHYKYDTWYYKSAGGRCFGRLLPFTQAMTFIALSRALALGLR